ncbi:MAG TPA: universal stress protein [Streptosporangiaceae bacterium]|jgi:nucleotide-binding universal stress UspA family protein
MTYKIVVGVDGSPASVAALSWSVDQAASRAGEVTALLAWQQPLVSAPGAFDHQELELAFHDLLVKTVRKVEPAPEVQVRTVLAEGDPASALLGAAREAAVLVLGVDGRRPLTGRALGPVSGACGASAPCPVVLVKGPAGLAEDAGALR